MNTRIKRSFLVTSILFFAQLTSTIPPKISFSKDASTLVEIQKVDTTIKTELIYATPQNFADQILYRNAKCLLHEDVVKKIILIQKELSNQNLGLKIWDAFRPLAVQRILWEANPDERFVANPAKGGGRHTRGTAVDLTLIKLDTGEMLEMPSEVSDFSRCSRNRKDMTPTARTNMLLLENIMKKYGLIPLASEWWHFDLEAWNNYPAIDLNFDEIEV